MAGPLPNVKVLDFSQGHGGPYCTMHLGDAGAEVIKVEPLDGDWARRLGPPFVAGESAYFLALNRNKKSITLDLKKPEGVKIALELAKRCDVIVENFRPGVAERLNIGYQAIHKINPRAIYCSMTALDSEGPEKDAPGTELTLQARGGVMRTSGSDGRPPIRFGEDALASVTGNYATQAIVAALFHRARGGQGQHVKVSMLRSSMHLQSTTFTFDCSPDGGLDDPRRQTRGPSPGYRTKDLPIGFTFPFMLAGYPADEKWKEFCNRIGLSHIAEDPRFGTRYGREAHEKELRRYYEEAFKDKSSAELLKLLEELGALNSPYNDFPSLFSHPQVLENDMVMEFEHPTAGKLKTVGFPSVLSQTPKEIRLPPPLLGQHKQEILADLGYSPSQIQSLAEKGVV